MTRVANARVRSCSSRALRFMNPDVARGIPGRYHAFYQQSRPSRQRSLQSAQCPAERGIANSADHPLRLIANLQSAICNRQSQSTIGNQQIRSRQSPNCNRSPLHAEREIHEGAFALDEEHGGGTGLQRGCGGLERVHIGDRGAVDRVDHVASLQAALL